MTMASSPEHPHPGHKRLIVNGDDFGLSEQVNAAILHAYRHGILTNASLMVSARAWRGAVELARATPSLQVGLHLTLVQGRSVLDHRHIPQLADHDGHFLSNPVRAGLRYFFSGWPALSASSSTKASRPRAGPPPGPPPACGSVC